MKPASFLLSTLIALPGAALAGCPTPDDLKSGIYLHFDDGDYTRYVRMGETYVQEDEYVAGEGLDYRIISHLGVYSLDEHGVIALGLPDQESRLKTRFGVSEAELPVPVAGMDWRVENQLVYASGGEEQELMQVEAGAEMALTIGDCTLTALPLTVTYEWPESEERMVQQSYYLIGIGISLIRTSTYNDEAPNSYTYSAISTETP